MDRPAFQDELPEKHCWGCGSLNEHGLQIKSYWSGEESVCNWQPGEFHGAGPQGILNGGIIATLIDCHSICTAVAAAYRDEGRDIGTGAEIWYATGALNITYLRPTPINGPVTLRARIQEIHPKKTVLRCSLYAAEQERARAEVVAVRVPGGWRKGDTL
jgi:acyl-coenzyme A thioesterase PaaI-like protein